MKVKNRLKMIGKDALGGACQKKMCGYEDEARSDEVENKVRLLVRLQLRF